jgi:hypothetical protein
MLRIKNPTTHLRGLDFRGESERGVAAFGEGFGDAANRQNAHQFGSWFRGPIEAFVADVVLMPDDNAGGERVALGFFG